MAIRTISIDDGLYEYMMEISLRETDVMRRLREATLELPSRDLASAPEQSQFLAFLIKLLGARAVIEVGVYTGYTTLAMACALPDNGELVACDVNTEWVGLAQGYWREAGVAGMIDLRLAPALETLSELAAVPAQRNRFDLIYIDADKPNTRPYYELGLTLLRRGGLIVIDNTFLSGTVIDPSQQTAGVNAIREINRQLLDDERVDLSVVPIGDGMTLARKR